MEFLKDYWAQILFAGGAFAWFIKLGQRITTIESNQKEYKKEKAQFMTVEDCSSKAEGCRKFMQSEFDHMESEFGHGTKHFTRFEALLNKLENKMESKIASLDEKSEERHQMIIAYLLEKQTIKPKPKKGSTL